MGTISLVAKRSFQKWGGGPRENNKFLLFLLLLSYHPFWS